MSYDERLASRLRDYFAGSDGVVERRMMGALCFMVDGHMCCGITGSSLMIRVGQDNYERVLSEPHVAPMKISGRTTRGFVLVDPAAVKSDADLKRWIKRGRDFIRTLPPKTA